MGNTENTGGTGRPGNTKHKWPKWIGIAALVVVLICLIVVLIDITARKRSSNPNSEETSATNEEIANEEGTKDVKTYDGSVIRTNALIPDEHFEGDAESFMVGTAWGQWWSLKQPYKAEVQEIRDQLEDFNFRTIRTILESADDNIVYSPLNLYMALGILSEAAAGETQSQILSLLGTNDMEALRHNVDILWNSNYSDTPIVKSQLANSLWLRSDFNYNAELMKLYAEAYHTDTFAGEMGTSAMNKALQDWTDEHTGGLLSEYTSGMTTDPLTVMEIVSTIYYRNIWASPFDKSLTDKAIFHGAHGDSEVEMMQQWMLGRYFFGDNYAAVSLPLSDSGSMYIILPDEGASVNQVLENDQIPDMLTNGWKVEYNNCKNAEIHLQVPKFTLSSKLDLIEMLKTLGVTEAFDKNTADFYSLYDESVRENYADLSPVYVDKIGHAAMVMIDEDGVTGAAYTEIGAMAASAMPEDEVDFTADRPFIYIVVASDGSILFAGTALDMD